MLETPLGACLSMLRGTVEIPLNSLFAYPPMQLVAGTGRLALTRVHCMYKRRRCTPILGRSRRDKLNQRTSKTFCPHQRWPDLAKPIDIRDLKQSCPQKNRCTSDVVSSAQQ